MISGTVSRVRWACTRTSKDWNFSFSIIPKSWQKDQFLSYSNIMQFQQNSKRFPKELCIKELLNNSQRIPKESLKNPQRIPKEFQMNSPQNSQNFENIQRVNFPIPYIALRGRKPFRAYFFTCFWFGWSVLYKDSFWSIYLRQQQCKYSNFTKLSLSV